MGSHSLSRPAERLKGFSWSRLGVCRWHGPGRGPNHTWQARAEQDRGEEPGGNWCRGGEVGKGKEEGKTCIGRTRAVLSEVSCGSPVGFAPGDPVPLLSGCTDTLLALLTNFGHYIVGCNAA